MEGTDVGMGRKLAALAIALFALTAVGVVGIIAGDGELASPLLVAVLAAAGLTALAAWAHERAATRRRAALEEKRRGDMADRARELDKDTNTIRDELTRERQLRLRTERARQAEREWTRELRDQVLTMYRNQGPNGTLRELVLQVALQVTTARKGLLLSRKDEDDDGLLDLVCAHGFDADPEQSSLAQRFAEEVIERDVILRESSTGDGEAAADDEIDSLIAIPLYLRDDFQGVIVCANGEDGFADIDDDVLLSFGDHAGAVLVNHRLQGRLRSTYLATVRMLADAIEAKDPFLRAHTDEVSACIEAVARRLDLDADTTERLVFAGLLRDVGKLGISDRVLLKPGPLNADERGIVQLHPLIGSRIVERVPGLAGLGPMIRHHHERWDGSGYPGHLGGDDIPLESRVIAVADAYIALTSARPYRRAVTPALACEEISRCAGTQFDPRVVELFVDEMRRRAPADEDNVTLAGSVDLTAVQARREPDEPLLGHGAVAATDHVTLLYSHRFLHEAADAETTRARRHQRPFAVVMAELSDLPEINRREGYAAGDGALQELGRAVEAALEGVLATPGRYSGRRLAVILPNMGHQRASAIASRVLEEVDPHGPTVRTGVAVWQLGDHGEDVLARARLTLDVAAAATE